MPIDRKEVSELAFSERDSGLLALSVLATGRQSPNLGMFDTDQFVASANTLNDVFIYGERLSCLSRCK